MIAHSPAMKAPRRRAAYQTLLDEVAQRHRTRRRILRRLEQITGRKVLSYFVSFADAVAMIEHSDSDLLEEALRQFAPGDTRGLTLIVNAPGGDGLAAERIVRVCRAYAGGDFEVIVPRMAKSAATMICFGANAIWMSETAELGPVDPQVGWLDEDRVVRMSARELILSYESLLQQAVTCPGNIEPYIQQLSRYDARLVETYRTAEALSASIAVNLLGCSMMRGQGEDVIKERIRPFLESHETRSHARAIYHERAADCGLVVRLFDIKGDTWQDIWELYLRSSHAVDTSSYSKLVETAEHAFVAAPKGQSHEPAQAAGD
jgi:hypothetical protein